MQWLAPLASEAPELIAVSLLAWSLRSAEGLGALVSSKVNQWTLLVGFVPLVFAVSAGAFAGLPIDAEQREELFLTAAQTLFAAGLLLDLSLSLRDAAALLGLFLLQFVLNFVLPEAWLDYQLIGIGALYLLLAVGMFVRRRRSFVSIMRRGLFTKLEKLPGIEGPHHGERE